MDPRVKTSQQGSAEQHAISMRCYEGLRQVRDARDQLRALRSQLRELRGRASQGALADGIAALERKAAALEGAGGGFRGGAGVGASSEPSLSRLNGELLGLMGVVEGADVAPTSQAMSASQQLQKLLAEVLSRWSELKDKDLKALNDQLVKAGLPRLAN
jgi:hypothetical protein